MYTHTHTMMRYLCVCGPAMMVYSSQGCILYRPPGIDLSKLFVLM